MPDLSRSVRKSVCFLLPLALTACNGGMAAYPSLAQRPAERAFATASAIKAPATGAIGSPIAATAAQVTGLEATVARTHAAFEREARDTDRLATAARGSGIGSEAWAAATTALAALESARSQTAVSLADLDALQVRTAVRAAQTSDSGDAATYQLVAEANRRVATVLNDEDARISALHLMLKN